jgi:hypothetical protein
LSDQPTASDPSPAGDPGSAAPGLGEQFGRTRNAFFGLIGAHVDLAKAEFGEILGRVKLAAALIGGAVALVLFAGVLVSVGGIMFLGELIFGSIGWGVLDGTFLLIGVAAILVLGVIDLGPARAAVAFLVALGVGIVMFAVLVVDWDAITKSNPGLPAGIVMSLLAGAVVIGLLGLVLGSSFGRTAATAGLVAGVVFGLAIGGLGALGPGPRVAAALGVATLLLFWPICAAVMVFRNGFDTDRLRARFVPDQTIATTKETIEWVREQMPLGRKS